MSAPSHTASTAGSLRSIHAFALKDEAFARISSAV